MHDDPKLIRSNQSKALYNDYEFEPFEQLRRSYGLPKCTATTYFSVSFVELAELYPEKECIEDITKQFKIDIFERDILKMELAQRDEQLAQRDERIRQLESQLDTQGRRGLIG